MRSKTIRVLNQILISLFIVSVINANEVQDVTIHKKSNGTLLRIVTSEVMNINNLAGWVGQENWFYVTLNATLLDPSAMDYLVLEPPVIDLEASENNESVQLGLLFDRPIEDFEIFHSEASRVVLIQVWESLNDSIRTEVAVSESNNDNRVFSLPKKESKGSPFYDSFVYARDKYGPEKYFVWYNKWYSTKDIPGDDKVDEQEPKPLVVKEIEPIEQVIEQFPTKSKEREIDLSGILDNGMLHIHTQRPDDIKILQNALVRLGFDLGTDGVFGNGVDGVYGPATEQAVREFQESRGFSGADVDGVVGLVTMKEIKAALSGEKPVVQDPEVQKPMNPEPMAQEPAPTIKETKREKRRLDVTQMQKLLPVDLTSRKTYIKLSCNRDGANVYIDGSLIGQTPIKKKISIAPGWHRVRMVHPDIVEPTYSIRIPDYQDIYVQKGRTQNIRINLTSAVKKDIPAEQDSTD